jgi:hypothetical protein
LHFLKVALDNGFQLRCCHSKALIRRFLGVFLEVLVKWTVKLYTKGLFSLAVY